MALDKTSVADKTITFMAWTGNPRRDYVLSGAHLDSRQWRTKTSRSVRSIAYIHPQSWLDRLWTT